MLEPLMYPTVRIIRNNLLGGVNQQGRPILFGTLNDCTLDTLAQGDDTVCSAWRHAEDGRNDHPLTLCESNKKQLLFAGNLLFKNPRLTM